MPTGFVKTKMPAWENNSRHSGPLRETQLSLWVRQKNLQKKVQNIIHYYGLIFSCNPCLKNFVFPLELAFSFFIFSFLHGMSSVNEVFLCLNSIWWIRIIWFQIQYSELSCGIGCLSSSRSCAWVWSLPAVVCVFLCVCVPANTSVVWCSKIQAHQHGELICDSVARKAFHKAE